MASFIVQRPASTEYPAWNAGYVSLVPDGDVLKSLAQQGRQTLALLRSVSPRKSQYRYAPGKWSVREVVGHLSDTERVFTFRALTFARADQTGLPAFDENAWAASSNAGERSMKDVIAEFEAVRAATLALFRGFTEEQFARSGLANNNRITVRALAYVTAGHERHHFKILKERYGL